LLFYLTLYGEMEIDSLACEILFSICHCPRAIIKIAKLFHTVHITDELLFKITMERLNRFGIDQEALRIYEWLMFNRPYIEQGELKEARQIGLYTNDVRRMYNGNIFSERWLLNEPFEIAFNSFLSEEESLKIIKPETS
jgi:hypothetical protein